MLKCGLILSGTAFLMVASGLSSESNAVESEQVENKYLEMETISVIGRTTDVANLGGSDIKSLPIASMVVNSFEVQRLKFVDPDELLDRIPGETQVRNLRIPNGRKSYTVPLVDGLSLGSPYTGATQDITDVNGFNIHRVEIIKGPASALYPNNAFGGTINVVTRPPPKEVETRLWSEAGRYDRARLGGYTAGTLGNLGYFVDANTLSTEAYREQFENNRDQFSGAFYYQANDRTKINLRSEYVRRDEIFPGDLTQSAYDEDPSQFINGSDQEIESQLTALKLEKNIFSNGVLDAGYVYRKQQTEGKSTRGEAGKSTTIDQDIKITYRHSLGAWDTQLIGGVQFFEDESKSRDDNILDGDGLTNGGIDITSVFSQVELHPTYKLGFTMGVRYESISLDSQDLLNNESNNAEFSKAAPKFGITYSLNDDSLLWLGYAEGFLTPSLSQLYDSDSGNEVLKPEEASDIEFGLRGSSAAGGFHYDITYYDTDIDNYIVETIIGELPNGDDDVAYSNASKVNVSGVETVLEIILNDYWRFGLTHTYAKNTYKNYIDDDGENLSGNRIARSPDHHVNLRASVLPIEGLVIELELDDYSGYYTNDFEGGQGSDPAGKFDRDERLNLRITYDNGPLELWFHALNMTDTKEDRVGYSRGRRTYRLVDGFTVYAGVGYTF